MVASTEQDGGRDVSPPGGVAGGRGTSGPKQHARVRHSAGVPWRGDRALSTCFCPGELSELQSTCGPSVSGGAVGLGRMVFEPGPSPRTPGSPGHAGLWPPPSTPGSRQAVPAAVMAHGGLCPRPLVGRGRRSSISLSQRPPTSPCTSAGGRPPTTARCSLPTRWTSATSVPSSRARHSSSPQVSPVPRLGPHPRALLPVSQQCPPRGPLWGHLWAESPTALGLAVLTEGGQGPSTGHGAQGPEPPALRAMPHGQGRAFADRDTADTAGGGSRTGTDKRPSQGTHSFTCKQFTISERLPFTNDVTAHTP